MTTDTRPDILEHAIGAAGVLVLRLNDGDARLRGIDGDIVRIHSLDGRSLDRLDIKRGDGSLAISPRHAMAGPASGDGELLVELPAGATVVVEAGSADVLVEDLTGDQRLRTASGDLIARNVRGKLTVDAVSGDVEIHASGPLEALVRTVSGDLSLRAPIVRVLRATTMSGDISIAAAFAGDGPFEIQTVSGETTLEPIGDVRVHATTLTGDIRDVEDHQQTARGRGRKPITVGSGTGPTIAFRSTSGDLAVRRGRIALATPEATEPPAEPVDRTETLDVLRALERGEIDVAEAGRLLSATDDAVTTLDEDRTDA